MLSYFENPRSDTVFLSQQSTLVLHFLQSTPIYKHDKIVVLKT